MTGADPPRVRYRRKGGVAFVTLNRPLLAVRAVKEAVRRSADMPLEQAFTASFYWEQRRRHSEDAMEGPRAFAGKRKPVWRGS